MRRPAKKKGLDSYPLAVWPTEGDTPRAGRTMMVTESATTHTQLILSFAGV